MEAVETLLERPGTATAGAGRPTGTMRSILVLVHEDDQLDCRLATALSIARSCSGHLSLLQVIPVDAYASVDAFGTTVNAPALAMLEEQAQRLRERLERRLQREDVPWSWQSVGAALVPQVLKAAALADLLVIGREPQDPRFGRSGRSLLGEILCRSRTPLCIPGSNAEPLDPFGSLVIAWNGSIEAANAVRQSIGLIKMASGVRVIRMTQEKEASFPDTRLLEYLSHHGVHAQLDVRSVRHDFAGDLLEYAVVAGGSYLVMGGYSHSRAGEFLFGGVTRDLLREFPISLVMAH